jgi:hypothetical protein
MCEGSFLAGFEQLARIERVSVSSLSTPPPSRRDGRIDDHDEALDAAAITSSV